MTYHYGTETLADLNRVCPGTLYLRNAVRKLVADHGADRVTVIYDGEVEGDWAIADAKVTDAQAMEISQWVVEIDDMISINFSANGKRIGSLFPVYDGPYTKETAEEIINDYQTKVDIEFDLP